MLIALIIILIHTVGDFLFQQDKEAKAKSYDMYALTWHVTKYTLVWLALGFVLTTIMGISFPMHVLFCIITFICHWITDYYTSKRTKVQFEKQEWYTKPINFGVFTTIQFDQILHYSQLFLTYYLLFL